MESLETRKEKTRNAEIEEIREMCFSQGQPCTYNPRDDPNVIITEWANGVTDTINLETREVERAWPDGRRATLAAGSTEHRTYPHVRREAT